MKPGHVWPALLVGGWATWALIYFAAPHLWWVSAWGAVGLSLFAVGAGFGPQWQLFGEAVVRGSKADAVALTFDDGPHPEFTPQVLDLLREAGARATFFVVGERVEAAPGLARRILEEGHQLAFHGHAHQWSVMMSPRRFAADYARGMDEVHRAAGVWPRYFRPPVGLVSPPIYKTVAQWGSRVAAWSVRPFDGAGAAPEAVVDRVLSKVRAGDIVLLHDSPTGRFAGERPSALAALPGILRGLRDRGLASVTLADLVDEPPYLEESVVTTARAARPRRNVLEYVTGITIALLLFGAVSTASAAELPADLQAACTELAAHTTVQGRFTQTKTSALFATDAVRTGSLKLRRADGRLLWAYDDGVSVLMAKGRFFPAGKSKEELGPAASGWALPGAERTGRIMEALFSLDPVALSQFFAASGSGGTWTLTPDDPAAARMFTSVRLTIGGDPTALRRIEMDEATGDKTVVEFTDLKLGEALPDDLFRTPSERSGR